MVEDQAGWGRALMEPEDSSPFGSFSPPCVLKNIHARERFSIVQAFYSRLLLDSYRLLAAPERSEWARAPLWSPWTEPLSFSEAVEGVDPTAPTAQRSLCDASTPMREAQGDGRRQQVQDGAGSSSWGTLNILPPLIPPPPPSLHSRSAAMPYPPSPHPADWERRMRNCLSHLERRPLLCPEELLRRTGAMGVSPSDHRGGGSFSDLVVKQHPGVVTSSGNGSGSGQGVPQITEACLLVALDLTEEAILEGGGEAAVGLLRALRTNRMLNVDEEKPSWQTCHGARGGGSGYEISSTLAGSGRGQVESGVMSALLGLLEEVSWGEW